ncbi:MAG: hypothetical protein RJA07_2279 [Bacteroidota bacterium]|jgi:hypothetical protein
MKLPVVLIVIGIVITLVGFIWGFKVLKPIHLNLFSVAIVVLFTLIGGASKWLMDISSSVKSDKILNFSQATAKQTEEVYSKMTGGKSYCLIDPTFEMNTNTPTFSLRVEGVDSLKNIQISIEDEGRREFIMNNLGEKNKDKLNEIIKQTQLSFFIPVIYPMTLVSLNIPFDINQKSIRMRIWINLDNGNLFEIIEANNFRDAELRKVKLQLKRGNIILKDI